MATNPWLRTDTDRTRAPDHDQTSLGPSGPDAPQPGVPRPPAEFCLPMRDGDIGAGLWVLGVHGGSGESNLAGVIPTAAAGDHAWPAHARAHGPVPVVLCARTHATGLLALQRALAQWASGSVPGVRLLGVVLIADAPGHLPRALRHQAKVVTGGAPRHWNLPWIESWRTGPPELDTAPKQLRILIEDLTALSASTVPEGDPR